MTMVAALIPKHAVALFPVPGALASRHCDRPIGAVCRQNPQAGRKVAKTEPVHLIVSRGPRRPHSIVSDD
jgi:hypothetical protein